MAIRSAFIVHVGIKGSVNKKHKVWNQQVLWELVSAGFGWNEALKTPGHYINSLVMPIPKRMRKLVLDIQNWHSQSDNSSRKNTAKITQSIYHSGWKCRCIMQLYKTLKIGNCPLTLLFFKLINDEYDQNLPSVENKLVVIFYFS